MSGTLQIYDPQNYWLLRKELRLPETSCLETFWKINVYRICLMNPEEFACQYVFTLWWRIVWHIVTRKIWKKIFIFDEPVVYYHCSFQSRICYVAMVFALRWQWSSCYDATCQTLKFLQYTDDDSMVIRGAKQLTWEYCAYHQKDGLRCSAQRFE